MIIAAFLQDELKLDISVQDIARAHRLGSLARARARYDVTRRPLTILIAGFFNQMKTFYILIKGI